MLTEIGGVTAWKHSFRAPSGDGIVVFGGQQPYLVTRRNLSATLAMFNQAIHQSGATARMHVSSIGGQPAMAGGFARTATNGSTFRVRIAEAYTGTYTYGWYCLFKGDDDAVKDACDRASHSFRLPVRTRGTEVWPQIHSQHGVISLSVPTDWRQATAAELPNTHEAVAAMLPMPFGASGSSLISVYASSEPLPVGASLDDYERRAVTLLRRHFGFHLHSRTPVKVSAGSGDLLQLDNTSGDIMVVYLIPSRRRVYLVTFPTGRGAATVFKPTFEAIANTLRTGKP